MKAQALCCRELTLWAAGNAWGLRAGYVFEIDDAPSELPGRYLAFEVRHAGVVAGSSAEVVRLTGLAASETYRVEVSAIPADVQFRAQQSTPWPRVYELENGTVDGPVESDYAQIDDQGRYLVRFKFDDSGLPDGSTSTFLRMMQPHGGTIEGWHFPLRKGTEVVLGFQGGDPDRPVIAGVVPNAQKPSTVTSANHTKNVLRTGGNNLLEMDDLEGAEYIDLGTPRDKTWVHLGWGPRREVYFTDPASEEPTSTGVQLSLGMWTEGNIGFYVHGDWWQNVNGASFIDLNGAVTARYHSTFDWTIHGNATIHYMADLTQTNDGGVLWEANSGGSHFVKGDCSHVVSGARNDDSTARGARR